MACWESKGTILCNFPICMPRPPQLSWSSGNSTGMRVLHGHTRRLLGKYGSPLPTALSAASLRHGRSKHQLVTSRGRWSRCNNDYVICDMVDGRCVMAGCNQGCTLECDRPNCYIARIQPNKPWLLSSLVCGSRNQ